MGRIRWRWPLWAMMAVVAGAAVLFVAVKPLWPGWVKGYRVWQTNRSIQAQLARSVPMTLSQGANLAGLLAAVSQATRGPEFPAGVPVFIDPQGMQGVGATMMSPVVVNAANAPVGNSLRAALRAMGLDYRVRDGIVTIVNPADAPEPD